MSSIVVSQTATLHTFRLACSRDRANAYDAMRRKSLIPPTSPTSLASSNASDTRLYGDLVDLQEELRSFEDRLYEPTVGTLMDTHAAMTGDLYDLRDDLRSR